MRKRLALVAALGLIVLSSAGIVTFISAQDGRTAASDGIEIADSRTAVSQTATPGVAFAVQGGDPRPDPRAAAPGSSEPPEAAWAPDRVYPAPGNRLYRVSAESGILFSADGGASWTARNEGLPTRMVYPFDTERPPLITSFAVDPVDGDRVALTLPDMVFFSVDGGASWSRAEVKEPLKPNDQLTAVALHPTNPRGLLVGTSFHGFFETDDAGASWADLTAKVPFLSFGAGSYEEIASLAYAPSDPGLIYFGLGFGKGLYSLRKGAKAAVRLDFPGDLARSPIRDLWFRGPAVQGSSAAAERGPSTVPAGSAAASPTGGSAGAVSPAGGWDLVVRTGISRWAYSAAKGAWQLEEAFPPAPRQDPAAEARRETASGRYGLYVSANHAGGKSFDALLSLCKARGLNSIIVDFKDEYGLLAYDSALDAPRRIGAVRPRFSAADMVQKVHASGLYLVARVVVFRDRQLYNADGYAYAVWDRVNKGPWRFLKKSVDPDTGEETLVQGEYWVDPYSEAVWRYNADIAREIQERGVDEVQFDYIRFPSDGDLSRISYRYRREGMGKLEALESFLKLAREKISIPISTDVYGYCGWARISNWVAQNIELFSRYVDVISPMYYPSHFPRAFLGSMDYLARAKFIYSEGGDRAAEIVQGRSIIRPYVQAFRIGGELSFPPAVYSSYLVNQVQGVLLGASSGFTLWNASNDYYMLTGALTQLISSAPETAATTEPAR